MGSIQTNAVNVEGIKRIAVRESSHCVEGQIYEINYDVLNVCRGAGRKS